MDPFHAAPNDAKPDHEYHRSTHVYEQGSLSWSSSLPSLTSTSSSLTSVSLSSRSSDLELLGRVEEDLEGPTAFSKRTPRRYHIWMKHAFSRDSSSSFFRFKPGRSAGTRYWRTKFARTTLWDRVVFVLFCYCLWTLLRALGGFGDISVDGGSVSLSSTSSVLLEPTVTPLLLLDEQNALPNATSSLSQPTVSPENTEAEDVVCEDAPP